MIKINRIMTTENVTSTSDFFTDCQASFNSDGNITLRNYNGQDKDKDEIIILSSHETNALFNLFSKIGQKNKNYDLPF